MNIRAGNRGAALLIAVSIMTILLLVGLTFLTVTRLEVQTSASMLEGLKAGLMADAGAAIAMHFLNYDFVVHAMYTSTDHAWRTYFNGAWAAGKQWACVNGRPLTVGGVPEIQFDVADALGDWLYVPRIQDAPSEFDSEANPFVLTTDYGASSLPGVEGTWPDQQVSSFTDVDNDGDGLKDSIWIPIGADQFFTDDGIDNDLDGEVDEQDEACIFAYWGGQSILLTAPIRSPYGPPNTPNRLPWAPVDPDGYLQPFQVSRFGVPYWVDPRPGSPTVDVLDNDWNLVVNDHQEYFPVIGDRQPDGSVVNPIHPDLIQRPYDRRSYGDRFELARTTHQIAPWYLSAMAQINDIYAVCSSGEPVCELVGRVAILINDEAGKVNVNAAGGHAFDEAWDKASWDGFLHRQILDGLGPWEYETRVLPGIGVAISSYMWALLNGAPRKYVPVPAATDPQQRAYEWDMAFPGYGRVDDDGNALLMALDGVDNDGDGLIDEGFRLPAADDPRFDDYWAQLGALEGIDEPQERRLYRPYRNIVAENDGIDNDATATTPITDEIGELGDRVLNTREELKLTYHMRYEYEPGRWKDHYPPIKRLVTVHSLDRPKAFFHRENGQLPEAGGMKLDYNYAPAEDIALMLKRDWERHYQPIKFWRWAKEYLDDFEARFGRKPRLTELEPYADVGLFAAGLRQEDVTAIGTPYDSWFPSQAPTGLPEVRMLADNELRAYKLAANIKDYGDEDHTRTEVAATIHDDWWDAVTEGEGGSREIEYTMSGIESIRINELMVRPVRRVEAEMLVGVPELDPNSFFDFQFDFSAVTGLDDDYRHFPLSFNMVTQSFLGWGLWRRCNIVCENDGVDNDLDGTTDELGEGLVLGEQSVLWAEDIDNGEQLWLAPDVPNPSWEPNVVQFRFGPSTGLPPGRYYLLINTGYADGAVTVGPDDPSNPYNTNQIEYAIKYGYKVGPDVPPYVPPYTDILSDLDRERYGGPSLEVWGDWNVWQLDAKVGFENMEKPVPGTESGFVFLPSRATPPEQAEQPDVFLPPLSPHPLIGYKKDYAYTVVIPEYWDPAKPKPGHPDDGNPENYETAADQVYLYVAIRKTINWFGSIDLPPIDNTVPLAIDFFDFSQEPDHEWIELINIAEWNPDEPPEGQAIDMSGWQVSIGPLGADGSHLMTIPQGTRIAPGGMLLLACNKHDYGVAKFNSLGLPPLPPDFINWDDFWNGTPAFQKNGIGLATHTAYRYIAEDGTSWPIQTVPTTADPRDFVSVPPTLLGELTGPSDDSYYVPYDQGVNPEMAGSVFKPLARDPDTGLLLDQAFMDVNGDGVRDGWTEDDAVWSTQPRDERTGFRQEQENPDPRMKAWDRIVELESELDEAQYIDDIAKVVLGGGMLPNYPEHDGIDNDDDGYVLDGDDVDNDGNGLIDEGADGIDNNGNNRIWEEDRIDNDSDGVIDEKGEGIDEWLESEGIDEGRWDVWENDGIDNNGNNPIWETDWIDNNGNNPIWENDGIDNDGNNPIWETDWIDNDGDGFVDELGEGVDEPGEGVDEPGEGVDELGEGAVAFFDRPGSFQRGSDVEPSYYDYNYPDPPPIAVQWESESGQLRTFVKLMSEYSGVEPEDAPAWREFVERRWYPGDCVIVTLYEGRADLGRVVDRVTYTERDVINRAIDDGVPLPRYDSNENGIIDNEDAFVRDPLNVYYNTMWPENTMGIDFYRSLGRKHPLYSGDRFGTRNRWQATDGNYDDWDESLSMWASTLPLDVLDFSHTLIGSPLRLNFFHRRAEGLLYREDGFGPLLPFGRRILPNIGDPIAPRTDRLWEFNRGDPEWTGSIRNRPYKSAGDVQGMPHFSFREYLNNGYDRLAPFGPLTLFDDENPDEEWYFGHTDYEWVDEILLRDRLSGELLVFQNTLVPTGLPVDRAVLAAGGSTDAIVLTVAQAEEPLHFDRGNVGDPSDDEWSEMPLERPGWWQDPDDPQITLETLPPTFTPVYLFSFNFLQGLNASQREDELPTLWTALFDGEALFNPDLCPGFAAGLDKYALLGRCPAQLRRVFYFTRNFYGFLQGTADSDDMAASPTAFFAWRADAGVENGVYDVSVAIGDVLEGLRDLYAQGRIPPKGQPGSILTPFGEELLTQVEAPSEDLAAYVKFYTDPKYYRDPDLINNPGQEQVGDLPERLIEPGPNGIAHYGSVIVEHNFLAMRIRNWSPAGQICSFSRVILTPRDRVSGRININTAATHRVDNELFNPLMGLPGLLAAYDAESQTPIDAYPATAKVDVVGQVEQDIGLIDWLHDVFPPPVDRPRIKPDWNVTGPNYLTQAEFVLTRKWNLYDRATAIMNKRPEWPDGRYYRQPSDLLGYIPFYDALANQGALPPSYNAWDAEAVYFAFDRFIPAWSEGPLHDPLIPGFLAAAIDQEIADRGIELGTSLFEAERDRQRFNESSFRYSRLFNLVTTRSDVFEIIVTAQSGYGVDANRDGRINYRDPEEFIVNSEKKTRTIYSR